MSSSPPLSSFGLVPAVFPRCFLFALLPSCIEGLILPRSPRVFCLFSLMCILSLVSFVFLAFSSFGSVPAATHSKLDRMGLLVRQWPKTHHQGNKGAAKEEAHWGHGVARLRHTDNLCRELKLGEFLYGAVSLMTKNTSSYCLWLFYKIEWWQIHVNTGSSKSSYQSAKTTLETSATDPFITWLKSVCCEAEKKKWGVTPEFSTLLYVYT